MSNINNFMAVQRVFASRGKTPIKITMAVGSNIWFCVIRNMTLHECQDTLFWKEPRNKKFE